ncbi:MAG: hypothetical protein NZM43_06475 [Saprospiraceae bacterium]|nr:hypothetical protein [Saprospiraceae bacterium]MDW8483956.1 hypothetical protein [Saprospiraceae bacterium]
MYDNLEMEVDFRSIYATLLRDWFCVPEADVPDVLLHRHPCLPGLFRPGVACATSSTHEENWQTGQPPLFCRPDPFHQVLTMSIKALAPLRCCRF